MRVITVPLKPEKWQTDLMYKRMNLCGSLYNRLADEKERAYHRLLEDIEYRVAINTINSIYELPENDREKQKRTPAYKYAIKTQAKKHQEYGFTAYSFMGRAMEMASDEQYKKIIPTRVASYTIGKPLWISFSRYIFHRSVGIKRKALGEQSSVTSDGRSGIRLLYEKGGAQRNGVDTHEQLYIQYGKSTGKRILRIPVNVNGNDKYFEKYLAYPMQRISIVKYKTKSGKDGLIAKILVDDSRGMCLESPRIDQNEISSAE